jgi:hypothetical protein
MARSNKVTVWNAAQHVLKVGHRRLLLSPGHTLVVERDGAMDALLESGKLIIVENVAEVVQPVVEEQPKKKKKETVETPEGELAVDVIPTEDAEDSILPEEVE